MSKYFRNNFTNINNIFKIVKIFYLDKIEYYWKYSVKSIFAPQFSNLYKYDAKHS